MEQELSPATWTRKGPSRENFLRGREIFLLLGFFKGELGF